MNKGEIERLSELKTYLNTFKHTDRRSINNGFFIGQKMSKLPQTYKDFKSFGRLGVSSFKLNWDYSNLRINFKDDTSLKRFAKKTSNLEKIGGVLSKYSSKDLQLVSCLFWNNGNSLSAPEKRKAIKIKKDLMKNL